jgi:hypothetical protein
MGHYYADMMCDTCGQVRCVCIRPEQDEQLDSFIVDRFEVMSVREFMDRHRGDVMLNMLLAMNKKYKTRLAAEKAARKACEQAVEAARFNLTLLKKTLKVDRPWELKK